MEKQGKNTESAYRFVYWRTPRNKGMVCIMSVFVRIIFEALNKLQRCFSFQCACTGETRLNMEKTLVCAYVVYLVYLMM
jgi:hypothetical protein